MSNYNLVQDIIRLGFRCGPIVVLRYNDIFHLVRAVFNGHATLTKHGRKTLMDLRDELKRNLGEV